ncbi:porin [Methylobacterium indicum]|uniref:Porin n=1 Tax=Methylobacterium indicum TaxID=1775910 RepID=A0ABR5GPW1_9HYPH|nr:porin family protein [Methylobacterium indicum]KMO10939.1 porin [Methylobacterium indicum]KMO13796.1 porin [Methylobacterium indicum]KTS25004.1 porin [Methylobacterium indicum]KTS25877.1 porin [Methylobacterium indicum]KTS53848.1 porin [Methylobacterium indicum]
MFKSLLTAGTAVFLSVGAASAADLPRRAAPPPVFTPVPVFTWTGAYFGINAGYAYTEADRVSTVGIGALQANVTNGLRRASVPLAQDGFTAGGQVGYNYQFTPGSGIVVGLEADAAYTDLNRRRTESIFLPAFNANRLTNTYRADLSFLGTVRGRIGYAFDRFLVYGTGGFAYGDVTQTVAFQTGAPQTYFGNRSRIETGYAYGGGVEYAMPTDSFLNVFKSNAVTVKAEYIRYDLGSRNLLVASTGGPGVGYVSRFRTEGSLVRAGLNFKFGTF